MSNVSVRAIRRLEAVSTVALLSACAVTPTPFTADEFIANSKNIL
ncbi:hypothetical protein [Magnetospirillum moscoviense]|nr:hypothetical protein [Magnetospirillum moscoviense]